MDRVALGRAVRLPDGRRRCARVSTLPGGPAELEAAARRRCRPLGTPRATWVHAAWCHGPVHRAGPACPPRGHPPRAEILLLRDLRIAPCTARDRRCAGRAASGLTRRGVWMAVWATRWTGRRRRGWRRPASTKRWPLRSNSSSTTARTSTVLDRRVTTPRQGDVGRRRGSTVRARRCGRARCWRSAAPSPGGRCPRRRTAAASRARRRGRRRGPAASKRSADGAQHGAGRSASGDAGGRSVGSGADRRYGGRRRGAEAAGPAGRALVVASGRRRRGRGRRRPRPPDDGDLRGRRRPG